MPLDHPDGIRVEIKKEVRGQKLAWGFSRFWAPEKVDSGKKAGKKSEPR